MSSAVKLVRPFMRRDIGIFVRPNAAAMSKWRICCFAVRLRTTDAISAVISLCVCNVMRHRMSRWAILSNFECCARRYRLVHYKNICNADWCNGDVYRYSERMETSLRAPERDATAHLVAANLAAELTRQRWSGRKAAAALGLTNVYVSRRASGEVECSASDLAMFAEFLSVPIAKFFEGLDSAAGESAVVTSLAAHSEPEAKITVR
jgi:hypothetical protein